MTKDIFDPEIDKFYAVAFENHWYLGQVLKKNQDRFRIRFLENVSKCDNYVWPQKPEIENFIPKECIFYGPIVLGSVSPFLLKRADKLKIAKLYSQSKKNFKFKNSTY